MKNVLTILSTLLAGGAIAHAHIINSGDAAAKCSPHGATASTGASSFSSCGHTPGSGIWSRDFSCAKNTGCAISLCGGDDKARGISSVVPTSSGCSGGQVRNAVSGTYDCYVFELKQWYSGGPFTVNGSCH